MQQESRHPDNPNYVEGPLKAAVASDHPIPIPRPLRETRKASQSPASDSLTAKMQDYRNWWNLPRTRSRKPHT